MRPEEKPRVLFIGGSDSSGGAGLLRDCATAADCGVAARVAVTAVTAQDDRAVTAIHPVPPGTVAAQIAAASASDLAAAPFRTPAAIKIGMLCSADIAEAVAGALPRAPLVLDPVVAASSGRALLEDRGIAVLIDRLVPITTVLTPNLPELAVLARHLGLAEGDEAGCVAALLARGCGAVLVKGGHGAGAISEDRLYRPDLPVARFAAPRCEATLRGTGCQLASAIAAGLALGQTVPAAVEGAKARVLARFRAQGQAQAEAQAWAKAQG